MIEVERVTFAYKDQPKPALLDLNIECQSGGITVIVGASGVGKSTLIALLAGIHRLGDPIVRMYEGGVRIAGMAPENLRGPQIVSWVPQSPALLDHLTVAENVLLPARIASIAGGETKCGQLLEQLGLGASARSRPRELSGGMRTRVSLARALMTHPKFLFLDEPFSSLDLMHRWKLYGLLREARQSSDLITVMTTHNIPEAMLLADRVILIADENGRTTASQRDNASPLMAATVEDALVRARVLAQDVERDLFRVSPV